MKTVLISKIETQYREHVHVRDLPRQILVNKNTKLNILLSLEEHHVTSGRQIARYHTITLKIINLQCLYKMQMLQKLTENDLDYPLELCELRMNLLEQDHIFLKWILLSDDCIFTLTRYTNQQNCQYW